MTTLDTARRPRRGASPTSVSTYALGTYPAFSDDPRCACRSADPNLFFPQPGGHSRRSVATAKAICRTRYSGSNGATEDSPTVPPTANSDLLLSVLTHSGGAAAFSATDPSAMTDAGQTQYADLFQTVAAAWQSLTSDGPTGVRTWTSVSGTGRQLGAFSIAVQSSDVFDPDPPLKPPAPELPPRLLRAMLAAKARELVGHQNTPILKFPVVSGGAASVNIVLTTPAPCDTTDVLVAFHGNNFFTAAEMLTPSPGAWTERALGDNGTNSVHQKIWTAKVTTPGIQNITFAPAQDEEHTAHLIVVTGVDPDDFIDGTPAGSNGAASTSHIAPAASPTTPNALLLYGAMSASESNYSIPAGAINNGAKIASEADVASFCTGATACQELATSGSTGTRTLTSSANSAFATATIAIKAGEPAAEGGPALSGPADTAQHTTTDTTAVKAATADAPTTQRTATTASGVKNIAAATTTTQHPATGATTQKQATGPTEATARVVAETTGAPGTPAGPAATVQHTTTTATTTKGGTGTGQASPHTSAAATGQKQTAAPATAPQRNTATTTGGKQATTQATASTHPTTQATTTVIPTGPTVASAHPTTATTSTAARSGTARSHPHTNTNTAGQRATTETTAAPTRTATTSSGTRTTSGAAHAALHPTTISTGQEIPAFTPAHIAVEADTTTTGLLGAHTTTGTTEAATTSTGLDQ